MQDLSNILLKLSQKILNVGESRKLKIAKLLLTFVDQRYFTQTSFLSISTFSQLNKEIAVYYKEKFGQKISQSLFYQIQLDDKFIVIYKLIMDLALNGEQKQTFLNAILDMTQNEKNLLMQFVGQVVKRHEFICQNNTQSQMKLQNDNLFYEEKFHQLKQEYKEFQKIYYQLLDNHQSLKKNHQKVSIQLTNIKQEKFELLDDLGLHHNAGYIDIIEKYRKDVQDFAQDMAKMHRQLDEKTLEIKRKQKQHQQLILSFSMKQQLLTQNYQQKSTQLIKKQTQIQKKLQEALQKQDEYRFQISRLKDVIVDLRKQLEEKNQKLSQQKDIIDKFNKVKKLHLQYRKAFLQNKTNIFRQNMPPSVGGVSL